MSPLNWFVNYLSTTEQTGLEIGGEKAGGKGQSNLSDPC